MLVAWGRLSFEDAPPLRGFIGVQASPKEAGQ